MEQVDVNASVSLGFRVEAVRGVRAYAIEFGNESHVDSLLGVPAMKPDDPAMPMWPAVVWRLGGELGSRRTHSRRSVRGRERGLPIRANSHESRRWKRRADLASAAAHEWRV